MSWVGLLLLAVAGFLVGGIVSTWRGSRPLAWVLAFGAVLAVAGGVAWLV